MLLQQSTIMMHKVFENAESIKTQVISRFLTKTEKDIKAKKYELNFCYFGKAEKQQQQKNWNPILKIFYT